MTQRKKIKNENKKKETTEGGNAHIAIGLMSKAMGVVSMMRLVVALQQMGQQ